MAAEFSSCVDLGVQLSKRIYYGKELRPSLSLSEPQTMTRSTSTGAASFPTAEAVEEYMPTAPMAYAVVPEPAIVDNPDVPSYQPYVHGRCDPPALVPLQMHSVAAEIDAHLDAAFVSVSATWRVHCVMASRTVDCRFAVPMGEKVRERA